jgi:hypothetical protein
LVFLPIVLLAQNKSETDNEFIDLIDKIDAQPISIPFKNPLAVNFKGGHLQGIQYVSYKQRSYYFLSGSSYMYSYYSVVKMGDENSIVSINKILDKPFKHAGGFQIYKNLMAIGVEDNGLKDRSKVFIYEIEDPENTARKILKIIDRSGAKERATAGCVGIIEISNYILVIVGDWDTKHLDFYRIKMDKINDRKEHFEAVYSIDLEKEDRSKWIDKSWMPYQNINFIKDSLDRLYLFGMATNDQKENVLDFFRLETDDYANFKIIKIHSRKFPNNGISRFNWGAGIYLSEENKLKIFSTGINIEEKSKFNIYE